MAEDPILGEELIATVERNDALQIIIAYLENPNTELQPEKLPVVIESVYGAVRAAYEAVSVEVSAVDAPKPAVPIEESVGPDFLICLEDGQRLKMLKRYLRAQHNMSPEDYRAKWGLPKDYPMVAPSYAERRSEVAKKQGLGRKPPPTPEAKRKPGRPRKTA